MPFNSRRAYRHTVAADIRVVDACGTQTDLVAIDLSRTGVGTDGLVQIEAGQPVTVEFPDGTTKAGTAVWRDDFFGGLLFERELTEEEFHRTLRSLASRPQFPK